MGGVTLGSGGRAQPTRAMATRRRVAFSVAAVCSSPSFTTDFMVTPTKRLMSASPYGMLAE